MTGTDYAIAFVIWIGYAAVAFVSVLGALRVTRNVTKRMRIAVVSLVLAVLFAPSAVGGGHGGGIGPAWLALFQNFPVKLGVVPIVATFAIFFLIGLVIFGRRKLKNNE